MDTMRTNWRLTAAIVLGVAAAYAGTPPAADAATRHRVTSAKHSATRHATSRRPIFRGARGSAAQEAARLGAAVGNGCSGRADMQRNDHQWVVLCSNGKTFVVEMPPKPDAPPVECSLAGIGPGPACFSE
jgi:hypothetical protein